MSSRSNQGAVELVLDGEGVRSLLLNLLRDGQDGSLGLSDRGLGTTKHDLRVVTRVSSLVNVNLSTSVVLDLVDGRTATAEDTSNRTRRDGERDLVVLVLLELVGLEQTSNFILCVEEMPAYLEELSLGM